MLSFTAVNIFSLSKKQVGASILTQSQDLPKDAGGELHLGCKTTLTSGKMTS